MEERQFGDRVHGLGFVLCPTWKKCRELTGDDTRRQVVIQGGYFFVETLAQGCSHGDPSRFATSLGTKMTEIISRIGDIGIVPVIVLDDPGLARPLGDALADGGLPCAEVTFRTARAAEALTLMAQDSRLVVGAGTVLTVEQVDAAIEAGATYIVTPGYSREIVRACQDRGVPVIPGVATPTEIQMALADGITLVKFFPAEAIGGTRALAAMAAPFPMLRFIPTGGISPGNLADYLALPSVVAVGGSWMVPASLVSQRKWTEVSRLAAGAVAAVAKYRSR